MNNTSGKSRQRRIVAIVVLIILVLGAVYAVSVITKRHEISDPPAKTTIQRLPQDDNDPKE